MEIAKVSELSRKVIDEVERAIVGKRDVLEIDHGIRAGWRAYPAGGLSRSR